jgi:hypothetical protein
MHESIPSLSRRRVVDWRLLVRIGDPASLLFAALGIVT